MADSATITFSQTGVQPPVYVVTSLSEPPWQTLEMHVDKAQTASANLIFTRRFDNVAEGDHQYKIRIGDGHWVVDESKDTATDEHGNRNNVLHVKAAEHVKDQNIANEPHESPSEQDKPSNLQDSRKDSTMEGSDVLQPPNGPIPFIAVEQVADNIQPSNGSIEPQSSSTDVPRYSADADSVLERTSEKSSTASASSTLPERPQVIVEKTDNRPAYGDDFGANATVSQRVAHDMRAADAEPNMLVITLESHTEPGTEEDQEAPLFRHESFQSPGIPSTPALATIDEASTEHLASEDATNTSSETSQYPETDHEHLLSHEISIEDEDFDELNNGPLLSHETWMNGNTHSSDEDVDELDAAPLLSHETGSSQYKGSEIATNSDYMEDNVSEPRHYMYGDDDEDDMARGFEPDEAPTFTHEDGGDGDSDGHAHQEDDTPLLVHERSHERDFAITDKSSEEGDHFTFSSQPTFGYEDAGDSARALFGGRGRPGIFRARSNSSTLPNKLPRTDEEDENLADPFLERFPTRREQILERVATIGLHLPEDESMEEHIQSPVMSVMSQACSSVDLAPVKSYTSLASVPEADDSDEEEDEADADVDSLPSPKVMNFSSASAGFVRDPHATPLPDVSRQLGHTEDNVRQTLNGQTTHSSEADSVSKTDGAMESVLSKLHEAIASPAKLLDPITPPLTPEQKETPTADTDTTQVSEPQIRHRQIPRADDSAITSQDPGQQHPSSEAVASSSDRQVAHHNETLLQAFFRVVLGPMGRFLTACVGDRKRAGITMLAAGVAAAAYYTLTLA